MLTEPDSLNHGKLDPEIQLQLDRLLSSERFRRAERLSALLRFLVLRASRALEPAKEYELGVDVFGRPVSYDPRTDPIVRVSVRELRLKLTAYYAEAGSEDAVRLEIPKGSYRVEFVPRRAPPTPVAPAAPVVVPRTETTPRRSGLWWAASVATLATVITSGTPSRRAGSDSLVPPSTPSVAILPFLNLSGDAGRESFSDGIADEIINTLMGLDGLRVTGRISSDALDGTSGDPQVVGRSLGVDAVLSGNLRLAGDRVRVNARLTDTHEGFEIWSRTFDDDGADPLRLHTTIAAGVAEALRIRLDPTSGQRFVRRSNDDPRAYEFYVQARQLAETRQTSSLLQSIGLFEQAIRSDPGYALAYVGLADAHGVLAFNGQIQPGDGLQKAREAARHALALDPKMGEAWAHVAHLGAFVDWDWVSAERHFRQAVELTPSHPRIHAWFGQTLVVRGRFAEGLNELVTAQRLDPLAPSITYALGEAYLYASRYEDALNQARRLLQTNRESWGGHNLLARVALAAGRPADAIHPLAWARGELWADTLTLVARGDAPAARALIDRRRGSLESTQPFTLASLYASAGDAAQSLDWLERAFRVRQVDLVVLAVDPALAPVRGDARFRSLVRQMGLAEALGVTARQIAERD